jgi:hypothetical protein
MSAAAEAVKQSPLARVKEEFGGKDKLVDKIVGVLDSDESKDELRKRLLGVANSKLIRLFSVATKTKQAGGHDKLVASTAEKLNRAKDKDYVAKLGEYSDGRLLDTLQAAERRNGGAAAAAKADGSKPPVAKAARPPRPAAKPAAKAEKPAAKVNKKPAAKGKKPAAKKKKR